MPQNLIEKIAQKFAVGLDSRHGVRAGDYLSIRPSHVLTHDNTGAVIPKFKSIGATDVADPRQPVFALDHNVQDKTPENLVKYAKIENFAHEHGIDFYPAGRGIGHQIMIEEGYAWPGELVVASDSHSNMYGGIGCLGTPIVRTDAAAIWATTRTWWQVPPVARVELRGKLRKGVSGKDVIVTLCGLFNKDEILNHALEFTGDGVTTLSISERLTIANMSTEWGALAGVFPIDDITLHWLHERAHYILKRGLFGVTSDADARNGVHPRVNEARIAELEFDPFESDPDADYAVDITLDLDSVSPSISGPNTVKVATPAVELRDRKIKIQKAYLLSCVNSRVEDLAEAANVLRSHHVAKDVKLYVSAASSEVRAESEKRGDWHVLVNAGAIVLPPGCGACIGLGEGLLEADEVGISATNRNYKGRMGAASAQAYLASPAVVAASALSGYIDLPEPDAATKPVGESRPRPVKAAIKEAVKILEGFPEVIEGELLFCHQDNLNTDGIYPGKYTYKDDMTPVQQAAVAMENYDPSFGEIARQGDILVGGFNFGTGSSREQAATCLKYRGIALVIAGTFSETYKRNAINNGFLVLEVPDLVRKLKDDCDNSQLTVRTGIKARIDFRNATLDADGQTYPISPVGAAVQELVLAGNLEKWVEERL